jgi:hypothetical protein
MDGRKNNGGNSTKGRAGRKPKADELKLIEQMDAVMTTDDVWQKISQLCYNGDIQALKLWVSYRFGQPKQTIDIENSDGSLRNTDYSKLTTAELITLRELEMKATVAEDEQT